MLYRSSNAPALTDDELAMMAPTFGSRQAAHATRRATNLMRPTTPTRAARHSSTVGTGVRRITFPQCASHHWRSQEHATITGATVRQSFESARGARSNPGARNTTDRPREENEYAPSF
jgi:hypothetical protein